MRNSLLLPAVKCSECTDDKELIMSELGQGYPCILADTVIDLDCLKYTSI